MLGKMWKYKAYSGLQTLNETLDTCSLNFDIY